MRSEAAVIEHEPTQAVAAIPATTPLAMIERAIASGAGIDVLEKLMALQERYEKNQARKAFDEAIAEAKAEISPVVKNREGHNQKRYADFAAIARAIDPVISKHGLSYRFRTRQDERIHVTCILSHRDGHSEETTLAGPADTSGSKNAIQAIGSTLSYLQRYSLTQALGLAASDDDDGKAAGGAEPIDEQQREWLQTCIVETGTDIGRFCKYLGVQNLDELTKAQYPKAIDALNAKRKASA
jgi:hypothetical protein